jgi:hypothetical protein
MKLIRQKPNLFEERETLVGTTPQQHEHDELFIAI